MTFLKWAALGVIVLMALAVSPAQQKFPLMPGEWEATTPSASPSDKPLVLLYCLNDELWTKALTQNPACSIQQLKVSLTGASYYLDCQMKTFEMKGTVTLIFDGMRHMVANGSVDVILNGKTATAVSQTDYRWKGPTCNPN